MSHASLGLPARPEPDPAPASAIALTQATIGASFVVTTVDAAASPELAREGLLPGSLVRVVSRVPLGGPLVVQLGRVRLALGATSAGAIRVVPCSDPAALDHD